VAAKVAAQAKLGSEYNNNTTICKDMLWRLTNCRIIIIYYY